MVTADPKYSLKINEKYSDFLVVISFLMGKHKESSVI